MEVISQQSQYFQQKVNYDIIVELDIDKNILIGSEKLIYTNFSTDTLEYVWFHLYPNAYKNDSSMFAKDLKERGINDFFYVKPEERGFISIHSLKSGSYELRRDFKSGDETVLKVFLNQPLYPNDSIVFDIDFEVKIPVFISRMGYNDYRYELTQWYPKIAVYDQNGWHNDSYRYLGEFYGEYGNFKVSISLPEYFWIAATGSLISDDEISRNDSIVNLTNTIDYLSKNEQKRLLKKIIRDQNETRKKLKHKQFKYKTVVFVGENVHDFAWVCDYRYLIKRKKYQDIDINIFVLPNHYQSWTNADEYAFDAIKYMTEWYGPYIYKSLSIVDSKCPSGGMEYPNLILIKSRGDGIFRTFEQILVHELQHQWFYGMLGNNEMNEAWLDEGLTMFSEMRYFETKYKSSFSDSKWITWFLGEQVANHSELMKSNLMLISSGNHIPTVSEKASDYRSRLEFGNVYIRTAFMMNMLKYQLKDSLFDLAMRNYYKNNLLKHPKAADLINAFNQTTQKEWNWYFNQWVYTQNQCNYRAGQLKSILIKSNPDTIYETSFHIIRTDSISMPLTVDFLTDKEKRIRMNIFSDSSNQIVRLKSHERIVSAYIDPDKNLLEFNQRDNYTNITPVQPRFLFFTSSFDKNTFVYFPLVNQTKYSKWGYGISGTLYDVIYGLPGTNGFQVGGSLLYYPYIDKYDYSLRMAKSTNIIKQYNQLSFNYSKIRGIRDIYIGFEIRIGKYRFENPSHNFYIQFKHSDLYQSGYFESYQAEIGKDFNSQFNYIFSLDYNLFSSYTRFQFIKGWQIYDYNYHKTNIENFLDFPINNVIGLSNFSNIGYIKGNFPRQETIFLSPTSKIDYIDLGTSFGYRRYVFPTNQKFNGKMASFVNENLSGKVLVSNRLDINFVLYRDITFEPFFTKIFFEIGKLWNSNNTFQTNNMIFKDAGIGLRYLGLDIVFPLWKNYKSNSDGNIIKIKKDNRIRFQSFYINLDFTYLLRLGILYK